MTICWLHIHFPRWKVKWSCSRTMWKTSSTKSVWCTRTTVWKREWRQLQDLLNQLLSRPNRLPNLIHPSQSCKRLMLMSKCLCPPVIGTSLAWSLLKPKVLGGYNSYLRNRSQACLCNLTLCISCPVSRFRSTKYPLTLWFQTSSTSRRSTIKPRNKEMLLLSKFTSLFTQETTRLKKPVSCWLMSSDFLIVYSHLATPSWMPKVWNTGTIRWPTG